MTRDEAWLLKEKYNGEKIAGFYADCKRLAVGEPLGYVIGQVPFLNCTIWLDSHPLIPRPETEFWTEQAILKIKEIQSQNETETKPAAGVSRSLGSEWGQSDLVILNHYQRQLPERRPDEESPGQTVPLRILDLCAGSGAIGVAVAKTIPETYVTFAELDPTHLPTIQKNLSHNLSVHSKVMRTNYPIVVSDLFEAIEETFDFILTNPPYIDRDANTVEESVSRNEPHLALFGGVGGMEVITRIIAGARAKLAPPTPTTPSGQLWLEHEPFQSEAIRALATANKLTCTTHCDQYQIPRYSVLAVS